MFLNVQHECIILAGCSQNARNVEGNVPPLHIKGPRFNSGISRLGLDQTPVCTLESRYQSV